ncbi:MAG: hypothetical protein K9K37_01870 [Desulfocapsa sp.]|nr:hypothetical protein [Desulfocapsa sp.]
MLSNSSLQKISTIPTASWALWNSDGPNDIAFFTAHLKMLHGRVVILGLNRGNLAHKNGTRSFINFHTPNHRGDDRLKRYIQGSMLTEILGCYMTDLSLKIETDSTKVEIDNPKEALKDLKEQLKFSHEQKRTIICIGNKTFDTLCKGVGLKYLKYQKDNDNNNLRVARITVGDEKWTIYRVWLHSSYGMFEHYGEVDLPKQLQLINDNIHAEN